MVGADVPRRCPALVDERKERPAMRRLVTILVLCGLAVGCGGSNPTAPSPPPPPPPVSISGSWTGTFESNYSPDAIAMTLTQVGASITGTWAIQSGTTALRATGTVSGTVDTAQFTGLITHALPSGQTCQGSFSGSSTTSQLLWTSPGFTGNCGFSAPGNPVNVRFVLQRR